MKLLRPVSTLPAPIRQSIFHRIQTHQRSSTSSASIIRAAAISHRQASTVSSRRSQSRSEEPLIPPPSATSGPLLERAPNRALPNLTPGLSQATKTWIKTLPIFIIICALGSLSIFNYQKSSSSTVNSILYALRTSPAVRDVLGDEIYFASRIPWISGELNQLHGIIDISFWVKGTKGKGKVRFVSVRKRRDGFFETVDWTLTTDKGEVVPLLNVAGRDPMERGVGAVTGQETLAEL